MDTQEPMEPRGPRRNGRGRSAKLDAAIAEATLRLLSRVGPAGLAIEGVARDVGCSKSSIYRRYGSKEGLILAASLSLLAGRAAVPVGGRQLEALTKDRAHSFRESAFVLAVLALMDEAIRGTDLGGRYLDEVFLPIRQERAEWIRNAIASGEIRPDTDIDLLLDVISGTLLFRSAHRVDAEDDVAERLTAMLLEGVGATPAPHTRSTGRTASIRGTTRTTR